MIDGMLSFCQKNGISPGLWLRFWRTVAEGVKCRTPGAIFIPCFTQIDTMGAGADTLGLFDSQKRHAHASGTAASPDKL